MRSVEGMDVRGHGGSAMNGYLGGEPSIPSTPPNVSVNPFLDHQKTTHFPDPLSPAVQRGGSIKRPHYTSLPKSRRSISSSTDSFQYSRFAHFINSKCSFTPFYTSSPRSTTSTLSLLSDTFTFDLPANDSRTAGS
jgi:hypothetical protein